MSRDACSSDCVYSICLHWPLTAVCQLCSIAPSSTPAARYCAGVSTLYTDTRLAAWCACVCPTVHVRTGCLARHDSSTELYYVPLCSSLHRPGCSVRAYAAHAASRSLQALASKFCVRCVGKNSAFAVLICEMQAYEHASFQLTVWESCGSTSCFVDAMRMMAMPMLRSCKQSSEQSRITSSIEAQPCQHHANS
eukprot:8320-Heterococcus_DN1.PRE.4